MAFIALYLASIVTVNILYSIITSPYSNFEPDQQIIFELGLEFIFIGLTMGARDKLHEIWKNSKTIFRDMVIVIFAAGAVGYISNYLLLSDESIVAMPSELVHKYALGSFFAFTASGLVNFLFYHLFRSRAYLVKITLSNIPTAIIDTLLFSFVALGSAAFFDMATQLSIWPKLLGGIFWGMLLIKFRVIG